MARQCCSGGSKCSTPEASTQQQLEPAACGYLQRLWMLCRLYKRGSQSLLYSASSQSEEDAFLLALFSHLTSPKEKMRHLHPCFTDSAVQLLAANSAWVASSPPVSAPDRHGPHHQLRLLVLTPVL